MENYEKKRYIQFIFKTSTHFDNYTHSYRGVGIEYTMLYN